jgi:hypothetical protein
MPKITMMGRGHTGPPPRPKRQQTLRAIVLPGIGDVIYTWYKLINYVDMGYQIDVFCLDCDPMRSHQLMGCLRGMRSFEYIGGFEYYKYWLRQVNDLRSPPPDATFNGIPVLHVNSWPESGLSISEFMPDFPCQYDLEITTSELAEGWASKMLSGEFCNIFLYTSSYQNNINCDNHPDPKFWADTALLGHEWIGSDLPPRVFMVGARYDADLTMDTHDLLLDMGVETKLVLDEDLYNVIEVLRGSDLSIAYESGFAMLADCMRIPSFWFIRHQGGDRDDKFFPYCGSVNPLSLGKWVFPFFYDQDFDDVLNSISEFDFIGMEEIRNLQRSGDIDEKDV